MVAASYVAGILGVKANSIAALAHSVERGLPKQALRRTADRAFAKRREATEFMRKVVPIATFKRRTRLTATESERTERLARVIATAEYVWSDARDAREWLHTPHPALDRKAPLQAALTELGARRVEAVLDRIFYGLPA